MKCRDLFTSLLLLFSCTSSSIFSQELPDTNTHFPRNFVMDYATPDTKAMPRVEFTPRDPRLAQTENSSVPIKVEIDTPPENNFSSATVARSTDRTDLLPKTVMRQFMSVYVNSADQSHLNRVLDQVHTLHTTGGAHISEVFHIGNYHTISADTEARLAKAGIQLTALSELPMHLEGLTSPVWEVFTDTDPAYVSGVIDSKRVLTYTSRVNGAQAHE